MEYELIDITTNDNIDSFRVEIEISGTRERKFFSYPKYDNWEDEIEGQPRFIFDIEYKLNKIESKKKEKTFDVDKIKKNLKGKKRKVNINEK